VMVRFAGLPPRMVRRQRLTPNPSRRTFGAQAQLLDAAISIFA
jgi:hypothetical protein